MKLKNLKIKLKIEFNVGKERNHIYQVVSIADIYPIQKEIIMNTTQPSLSPIKELHT